MTHEYVIALNGHIEPDSSGRGATAVGWAADAVLAVDTDDAVRAISRGDSTFLDLGGCVVTPFPTDLVAAEQLLGALDPAPTSVGESLVAAGLLDAGAALEPGSPADLAFWRGGRLVAALRAGHFSDGDAHRGPFPPPRP